jgi:hypothetical protein
MPMVRVHEFDQSKDKFDREPEGVCQALSSRWIVSRALWDPRRDGAWANGSWMNDRHEMEAHVWRIYASTRAARGAVALQEKKLMKEETERFEKEKQAALKHNRRVVTSAAALSAAAAAAMPAEATPNGYSAADLDARLSRVYIPALPHMLDALRKDIEEHGGLDGSVKTYNDVASGHVAHKVGELGPGYKLIVVRDAAMTSEGGAHAIAAELRDDEARLFDPNLGEFESRPPGNPSESLNILIQWLVGTAYELPTVRYLSVIHFPLKASGR